MEWGLFSVGEMIDQVRETERDISCVPRSSVGRFTQQAIAKLI